MSNETNRGKMKYLAYYLPQFHEIEENNEWWGDGFTEWTNVKKAKSLFSNHIQPVEPLDGYYNLLDRNVMERQSAQMKEYGIYGMAFYHYWFNKRLLLEKPVANLLQWKDIEMNFMFFWANHSWNRSWNGSTEILLKQTYGGKEDWEAHFDYMLPYFKDKRYIKKDNKPMIGIYMIFDIPDSDEMIAYWNQRAIKEGFSGVYIIETALKKGYKSKNTNTDAIVLRQPNIAWLKYSRIYNLSKRFPKLQPFIPNCYPLKIKYDTVMKELIKSSDKFKTDKELIYGMFTGWDNTPRHSNRGFVITKPSPEKFGEYLRRLEDIARKNNAEYIFINAWNEWGEGAHLEPDQKNKTAYLDALKEVNMD